MAASKKNIAKSIRISEEVFAYIDNAPGKGFNEKFENIILEAKETEADRKKKLADLEKRIHDAQLKLSEVLNEEREMREFFRNFTHMQHQLSIMRACLNRAGVPDEEQENNND